MKLQNEMNKKLLLTMFILLFFALILVDGKLTGLFTKITQPGSMESKEHHSPPPVVIEAGSGVETASYIIFHDDEGFIYAKNGLTGELELQDTDATTVIQSAINALTNGGTVFIRKASTPYSLTTLPIVIDNEHIRITGDYPNITINDNVMLEDAHALFHIKSSHVEIDHLILDGNGENNDYSASWGMDDGLISIWKYEWNTDKLMSTTPLEDIEIHHCKIYNARHTGIAVNKANKIRIHHNEIVDSHDQHNKNIHIVWAEDVEIAHNYIDINSNGYEMSSNNIMFYPAGGAQSYGVDTGCKRVTIKSNTILHSEDCPIEFHGGNGDNNATFHEQVIIENNFIDGRTILFYSNVRNSEIVGNTILLATEIGSGNSGIAISCDDSDGNADTIIKDILVSGNIIFSESYTGNDFGSGIKLSRGSGVLRDIKITQNTMHSYGKSSNGWSSGQGIYIDANGGSLECIFIEGNIIHNLTRNGIFLYDVSDGTITIRNNEIYNNGQHSVYGGDAVYGHSSFNGTLVIQSNDFYDSQKTKTQGGIHIDGNSIYGRMLGNRIEVITGLDLASDSDYWFCDGNDFRGCSDDVVDNSGTTIFGNNLWKDGSYSTTPP